jgi:hypothetical protein
MKIIPLGSNYSLLLYRTFDMPVNASHIQIAPKSLGSGEKTEFRNSKKIGTKCSSIKVQMSLNI